MQLIDQPLGRLARNIPGSTRVFRQYQLDFCCGGKQSLGEALQNRGIDVTVVIAELEKLQQEPDGARTWSEASAADLIDHIIQRYHNRHREQLPELCQLANRVEVVHVDHPECPRGLAEHLYHMLQELEQHMQKEEQILFPMLAGDFGIQSRGPMQVMRAEHDDHRVSLERIAELTHNLSLPRGACNTWRALYTGLEALRSDLMQHIHLENNILFADAEELQEAFNG